MRSTAWIAVFLESKDDVVNIPYLCLFLDDGQQAIQHSICLTRDADVMLTCVLNDDVCVVCFKQPDSPLAPRDKWDPTTTPPNKDEYISNEIPAYFGLGTGSANSPGHPEYV